MTLQEFITMTNKAEFSIDYDRTYGHHTRMYIICKDNVKISIQASEIHFCNPRKSFANSYESYELKFSSEDDIRQYVPHEEIEKILNEHGGIDDEKTIEQLRLDSSLYS